MKKLTIMKQRRQILTLAVVISISAPAFAQGADTRPDEKSQTDRLRTLAVMPPFANYVPLPSSSLGNGSSATWFLDPSNGRVISCAGNPTVGVRCTAAEIPVK